MTLSYSTNRDKTEQGHMRATQGYVSDLCGTNFNPKFFKVL